MSRRIARDYRSMTEQELRAVVREAHRAEQRARYAKGRRAWKAIRRAAEEELANRTAAGS